MFTENSSDSHLANLYEHYEQLRRRGVAIAPTDFAEQYPTVREDLLELISISDLVRSSQIEKSIPSQIAKYALKEVIGTGGMGLVFRARHVSLDRDVAIKVVAPGLAQNPKFAIRFQQEARAASDLDHPNIVRVFDYGVHDGIHWLAMPLVEGVSLDRADSYFQETIDSLDDRWATVARLGAQVASALGYAHEKGVIHRDIKPSNLLVDKQGKVYVTDFGLAKTCDRDTRLSQTGDIIGTPKYMAPEQLRGSVDCRSDIFALGVTLWELATKSRAWEAIDRSEILSLKSSVELERVVDVEPSVPAELGAIIDRATKLDPGQRYQSSHEFLHELNRFAHASETRDRRANARHRQTQALPRSIAFVALLAIVCLASLLTWGHFRRNDAGAIAESIDVESPPTERKVTLDFTSAESTAQAYSDSFIEVNLPLHNNSNDGVFTRIAGGPDAGLLVSDVLRPGSHELLLMVHPSVALFHGQDATEFEINVEVSSNEFESSMWSQTSWKKETQRRQLTVREYSDKSGKAKTRELNFALPQGTIDFASGDGDTFYALAQELKQIYLLRFERNEHGELIEASRRLTYLNRNAKGIATANGKRFFVAEQTREKVALVTYSLENGRLKEANRTRPIVIPEQVEAISTVDERLFTIFAKSESGTLQYKFGIFDDSTLRLSSPKSEPYVLDARAHWIEKRPGFRSLTHPIAIRMPKAGELITLQNAKSRRFLYATETMNAITSESPSHFRFVFVNELVQGNQVVNIRDELSGTYLDQDDERFNVDLSYNTGSDKRWIMTRAEDGTLLFRNMETGAYLCEESQGNAGTSHSSGPKSRWIVSESGKDATSK